MSALRRWDIFCHVIDNYGDAAVCWRLARELTEEHGCAVRLWIDDVARLSTLVREVAESDRQWVEAVEVRRWSDGAASGAALPDVVVEAFGYGLPPEYVTAMGGAARTPLWIVLEYLSAETWVQAHHGLPSPHPTHGIERYFFFPGFSPGTGGLLRERGLAVRRDAFAGVERAAFWSSLGYETPPADALVVSLFAYPSAPVAHLLAACERATRPVIVAVPAGASAASAIAYFQLPPAPMLRRGALEVRLLPFLSQGRYDELLWCCDINFVRGEDSFVRAQWAARPLVWHAYPQAEDAHRMKLDAFLDIYCDALPASAGLAVARMTRVWNDAASQAFAIASAWQAYIDALALLDDHAARWAQRLEGSGELAANLARFARDKLK